MPEGPNPRGLSRAGLYESRARVSGWHAVGVAVALTVALEVALPVAPTVLALAATPRRERRCAGSPLPTSPPQCDPIS